MSADIFHPLSPQPRKTVQRKNVKAARTVQVRTGVRNFLGLRASRREFSESARRRETRGAWFDAVVFCERDTAGVFLDTGRHRSAQSRPFS